MKSCSSLFAGWRLGNQDINAFVIFGVPDEDLQSVINTALYALQKVGSVVPMLFTPVPGSILFREHEKYLFDQKTEGGRAWDLQDLNGKLLPFLEYNRKEISLVASFRLPESGIFHEASEQL